MAQIDYHSAHTLAAPTRTRESQRKLHPAIYLFSGFGFIFGAALAVHTVFHAIW